MRYVFVSDIHGQLDKLKTALNEVAFDKDKDTLVSLGDPFDRGPDSLGVLKFLMGCPNRVLVWGNHDYRLKEIISDGCVYSHDYHNGVQETMRSFVGTKKLNDIGIMVNIFKSDDGLRDRLKLLYQYFDECAFAIEFSDLVGTHAWIPVLIDTKKTVFNKWGERLSEIHYTHMDNWREADIDTWSNTIWCHSQNLYNNKMFVPGKRLVIGHWHAWRFRRGALNIDPETISDNVFEEEQFVAIDGCSNAPAGKVNAWVYESDEAPVFITGR